MKKLEGKSFIKNHIYVCKVIENIHYLNLTSKEKEECFEIYCIRSSKAFEIMKKSFDRLKPSKYSDLYVTNFIIISDISI